MVSEICNEQLSLGVAEYESGNKSGIKQKGFFGHSVSYSQNARSSISVQTRLLLRLRRVCLQLRHG